MYIYYRSITIFLKEIRINIIGEIAKARDFDVDNLYIKYSFILPKKKKGDKFAWEHDYEDLKDTIEK